MCKQNKNTRYDMVPWVPIVIGVVGLFLGKVECAPEAKQSSFSCANRNPGYYADITTGCQVYHMCDNVGRQFSYSCPNATLFQQRMLICDHWYMVNCSKAVSYYDANLRIGQKDRHFVDDSEVNAVTRTPRPDLLTAPSTTLEYNTIYRHGESNLSPTKYVGVESNDENSTDEATYFPPSHWSTEISKQVTSSLENNENRRVDYQNDRNRNQQSNYRNPSKNDNPQSNYRNQQADGRVNYRNDDRYVENNRNRETYRHSQRVNDQNRNSQRFNDQNRNSQRANDQNREINRNPQQSDDQNRVMYRNSQQTNDQNRNSQQANDQNREINRNSEESSIGRENDRSNESPQSFDNRRLQPEEYNESRRNGGRNSGVKGKAIDVSSINSERNEIVNFKSNFKATTPVYPLSVKDTTRTPNDIGLQPPLVPALLAEPQQSDLQLELLPPHGPPTGSLLSEEGLFKEHQLFSEFMSTTPVYPSADDYKEFEQNLREPIAVPIHFESNFEATTPRYPTSVDPTSPEPSDLGVLPPRVSNRVNFESNYKATTPDYPSIVDPTSQNPVDVGLLPPNGSSASVRSPNESNFKATTPEYPTYVDATSPNPIDVGLSAPKPKIAYKSDFKATTPKYPSFVAATSPDPNNVGLLAPKDAVVNFHSDFRATTPDYPESVASTSPDPGRAGLLAPQPSDEFDYNRLPFKSIDPTSEYAVEEGDLQEIPGIRLSNFMKSFDYKQWQALRDAFRIPEYEFPLDDATRPSYNSVVNSFEPISSRK